MGHQCPCKTISARINKHLTKPIYKSISIFIVPKYFPAFDSPHYDVMKRAWGIYPGFSWHSNIISQQNPSCKSIYQYPYPIAQRRRIAYNQLQGYKKPKRDDARIMPPTADEFKAILGNSPGHLKRALVISYFTGIRPGPVELCMDYGLATWIGAGRCCLFDLPGKGDLRTGRRMTMEKVKIMEFTTKSGTIQVIYSDGSWGRREPVKENDKSRRVK